jgi:hypothetical protein
VMYKILYMMILMRCSKSRPILLEVRHRGSYLGFAATSGACLSISLCFCMYPYNGLTVLFVGVCASALFLIVYISCQRWFTHAVYNCMTPLYWIAMYGFRT